MTWVGKLGEFIPGVPARDLTAQEAEQHRNAIQQAQRFGRVLYQPVQQEQEPEPVEEQDDNG